MIKLMSINLHICLLVNVLFITGNNAQTTEKPIENQYIVLFKEAAVIPSIKYDKGDLPRISKEKNTQNVRNLVASKINTLQQAVKLEKKFQLHVFNDAITGFSAILTDLQVKSIKSNPDVAGVYQDFTISLDPVKVETTSVVIKEGEQYVGCFINTAGGYRDGSNKSNWIWIVDSGINISHPDLNVESNPAFAKSFINEETIEDLNGHGTHVAGIAAAKDNKIGMVGVSSGARVVPVKVLAQNGVGSFTSILAGLNHIARLSKPGDVVNLSLGNLRPSNCMEYQPAVRNAIQNLAAAGVWIIMAAGNNNLCNGADLFFPACIDGNKIISVASVDCNLACSTYSNWGKSVDFAAVGTHSYATYKDNKYATLSGTSMAAPVITGIVHQLNNEPFRSSIPINCCNTFAPAPKLRMDIRLNQYQAQRKLASLVPTGKAN
jgi:hypothetical protein